MAAIANRSSVFRAVILRVEILQVAHDRPPKLTNLGIAYLVRGAVS
jgi:hypothetical protein